MGSIDSWRGGLQSRVISANGRRAVSIRTWALPQGLVTSKAIGDEREMRPFRLRKQETETRGRIPKGKTENETPGHYMHSR